MILIDSMLFCLKNERCAASLGQPRRIFSGRNFCCRPHRRESFVVNDVKADVGKGASDQVEEVKQPPPIKDNQTSLT